MSANLSQIVKQALETKCRGFLKTVEEAARLLSNENGKTGNLEIVGRLVYLKPEGEALVIGDLHGDLESLVDILKDSKFMQIMDENEHAFLILLGDYGDRGPFSAEVYYTVLKLKLLYPLQVILMRGNHEGPEDLIADPHDLPMQFESRFGSGGEQAYAETRKLFPHLFNAVLVERRYLLIHGGLPRQVRAVEDLAYADRRHPEDSSLEEILWSDPDEAVEGTLASPRGAGRLFGKDITDEVLKKLDVRILIRAHESCEEGFKISHNGRILTLFSRKGPPYFNTYGAYLHIDLSERPESAEQLIPYIHKF